MLTFLCMARKLPAVVSRSRTCLAQKTSSELSSTSLDVTLLFWRVAPSQNPRQGDLTLRLAPLSLLETRARTRTTASSKILTSPRSTSPTKESHCATSSSKRFPSRSNVVSATRSAWMSLTLKLSSRIHGLSKFSPELSGPSKLTQRSCSNGKKFFIKL